MNRRPSSSGSSQISSDGSGFLPKHRVFPAQYINYLVCLAEEYCDRTVFPQHSEIYKACNYKIKIRAKYLKRRSHTYFSCSCVPIPFCRFSLQKRMEGTMQPDTQQIMILVSRSSRLNFLKRQAQEIARLGLKTDLHHFSRDLTLVWL